MVGTDGPFVELDDGVFVRRHESLDLNCGLVVGEDEALVIDTRAHVVHGHELVAAVAEVTPVPVRWVVSTHVHWDHVLGNAAFADAVVVGHDRTREILLADGEAMKAYIASEPWFPDDQRTAVRSSPVVPPVVTTSSELSVHVGGRAVRVEHHGRGHTDSDVVVHVGDVTFAGDLVEESAPPSFGDAYPDDWAPTLDRMLATCRPTVVPGHGGVVDRAFVVAQRGDVEAAVTAAHDDDPDGSPWGPETHDKVRRRVRVVAAAARRG